MSRKLFLSLGRTPFGMNCICSLALRTLEKDMEEREFSQGKRDMHKENEMSSIFHPVLLCKNFFSEGNPFTVQIYVQSRLTAR